MEHISQSFHLENMNVCLKKTLNKLIKEPIDVINNKPARSKRQVVVRPMKQSSIDLFGFWIEKEDWKEIFEAKNVDDKSECFQNILLKKVDEFFPQKTRVFSSDD